MQRHQINARLGIVQPWSGELGVPGPEQGQNLIAAVRRLQATLADAPIRDYTYLVLHPRTALALDCLDDPRVTVAAQVAVDACDSDTAYKGAQWALSISLVGLVGLAAWALFYL